MQAFNGEVVELNDLSDVKKDPNGVVFSHPEEYKTNIQYINPPERHVGDFAVQLYFHDGHAGKLFFKGELKDSMLKMEFTGAIDLYEKPKDLYQSPPSRPTGPRQANR